MLVHFVPLSKDAVASLFVHDRTLLQPLSEVVHSWLLLGWDDAILHYYPFVTAYEIHGRRHDVIPSSLFNSSSSSTTR